LPRSDELASLEPQPIAWERLEWLTEIPLAEREQWVMAPAGLTYAEASAWANVRGYDVAELIHLTSSDTLLRLRRPLCRSSTNLGSV
jgi:hypothetical protein